MNECHEIDFLLLLLFNINI